MDTTDYLITFDSNGVCDHCNNFNRHTLPNWPTGKDAKELLNKYVEKIKYEGKNKDYDCVLGVSGGIDSSYLAYIVKSELGLNPLVFHVDAGWNSQIAVNNIEKLVDGLDLDLYTEVIDWEEIKNLQLSFFKSGVSHIDVPQDHAFFATMYKFSLKHNIKFILTGGNLSTECIRNPKEWMYYQSDYSQLIDIHKKFGSKDLVSYPTTSVLWHKIYLPYFKRIRVVKLLDLIDYNKEDATNTLKEKFGWQIYEQKHFESRFTKFYEGYWLLKRFGFDTRRVQFSSLILTKQMDRKSALEKLIYPPLKENEIKIELEFISRKLGVTLEDLKLYIVLPKRTYKDYNNQAWLYDIGAKLLKLLRIEVGGKR